jgi:hypothetical protein
MIRGNVAVNCPLDKAVSRRGEGALQHSTSKMHQNRKRLNINLAFFLEQPVLGMKGKSSS